MGNAAKVGQQNNITCETTNMVYAIKCSKCNLQFIEAGKASRRIRTAFSEHRPFRSTPPLFYTQTSVSQHFLSSNHTETDLILILVKKIKSNSNYIRKTREAFLTHPANTQSL